MGAVTGDMKEFWKSWILMLVKVASFVSYKEACWGQVWELPNQIWALSAPTPPCKKIHPNFALTKWNHAPWQIFWHLKGKPYKSSPRLKKQYFWSTGKLEHLVYRIVSLGYGCSVKRKRSWELKSTVHTTPFIHIVIVCPFGCLIWVYKASSTF